MRKLSPYVLTGIFFLTTLVFAGLSFHFRYNPSCPEGDPATLQLQQDMIHSRDSVIERLKGDCRSYQDSLEAGTKRAQSIKKEYEKLHLTIRNADTRDKLDSLWSAFNLPE